MKKIVFLLQLGGVGRGIGKGRGDGMRKRIRLG